MKPDAAILAKEIISYLKDHDAYDQLEAVTRFLQEESYRNQAITVISAAKLSTDDQSAISATLHKKWGEHPVRFFVDASLVSGLIVTFQDKIIDQSGKGALNDLHQTLITP